MAQPSEQIEALHRALEALEQTDIPYAITGSWVISAYGILRMTHDLDVVVAVQGNEVERIRAAFPDPPYYVDEVAIAEALTQHAFFNIIDMEAALKIDFWPLNNDDYSQEQFRRRQEVLLEEVATWALTPEDIILAKLLWIQMSESERQWRDVVSVWQLKRSELDTTYLRHWAARLNLIAALEKIMRS